MDEQVAEAVEELLREFLAAYGRVERSGRMVEVSWVDGPSEEEVLEAVRTGTSAGALTGFGSLMEEAGTSYTYAQARILARRAPSKRAVATAVVLESILQGCRICDSEAGRARRRISVGESEPERIRSHPAATDLVTVLQEEGVRKMEAACETLAGLLPELAGSTHTQMGSAEGVLCGLGHLEGLYQVHSALMH